MFCFDIMNATLISVIYGRDVVCPAFLSYADASMHPLCGIAEEAEIGGGFFAPTHRACRSRVIFLDVDGVLLPAGSVEM